MADCATLFATAVQLQHAGKLNEAAKIYAEVLAQEPGHQQAHLMLGVIERKADNFLNMGICYGALWQNDKAIEYLRKALALRPEVAEAHLALGKALYVTGDVRTAIDCFHTSLRLDSTIAETHMVLGLAHIMLGEYEIGWKEFEWRLKSEQNTTALREFNRPRWEGEALEGRTILLHAEQGYGDTLQFVRYVSLVAEAGGRVLLEVQGPLVSLLRNYPGVAECVAIGEPTPEYDLHCPLMSLALMFGTTLQTIPEVNLRVPHRAEKQDAEAGARQAAQGGRLRVGLVWAGNKDHAWDCQRSLSLKQFEPLWRLAEAVQFVSLQKGDGEAQLAEAQLPFAMENAVAAVKDFADTAAIVAGLDLVIAVDTSVAHLVGSMQKPLWLLIPGAPDWRWGQTGETTPWYPTAHIFRASGEDRTSGDTELMNQVAGQLAKLCERCHEVAAQSLNA